MKSGTLGCRWMTGWGSVDFTGSSSFPRTACPRVGGTTNCLVIPAEAGIQGVRLDTAMDVKQPAVYILASGRNGTLYIGVTSDLVKRIWQHKNDCVFGFTESHRVHTLVFYEMHVSMEEAIAREKRLKKWNRLWKLRLIEESNRQWRDLWPDILGSTGSPPARG
jgi:putative endonuclease